MAKPKEKTTAPSKKDDEVTALLAKLYTMQEDIGAKPKSSDAEKIAKAENVAKMGSGKKAEKKGSQFLELKSSVVDRLKEAHRLMKESKDLENSGYGGDNAKDIIKMQAEVRENIRQATDEWKKLERLYKKEARKKKSKFSPEELEVQSELVKRLYAKIEEVKNIQSKGYSKGGGRDAAAAALNTKALSYDPNSKKKKGPSWGGTGGGVALTGDQQQQIQEIEQRDADFDLQLDEIGEGIQDLADIAAAQGEEVALQTKMLDKVDKKIDRNLDKMESVNVRMKDTLETVSRSSDKIMVDIMCVVLMIGFVAVLYKMLK